MKDDNRNFMLLFFLLEINVYQEKALNYDIYDGRQHKTQRNSIYNYLIHSILKHYPCPIWICMGNPGYLSENQ